MSVAFCRESDEEHLEPKFELPIPPGPNLVTPRGLALIEALDAAAPGMPLMLKWPNDLLLGGVKLAGILLERSGDRIVAIDTFNARGYSSAEAQASGTSPSSTAVRSAPRGGVKPST